MNCKLYSQIYSFIYLLANMQSTALENVLHLEYHVYLLILLVCSNKELGRNSSYVVGKLANISSLLLAFK